MRHLFLYIAAVCCAALWQVASAAAEPPVSEPPVPADFRFDGLAADAYSDYFRLRMAEADRHFALLQRQPRRKGVEIYLANYRDMLVLLTSDDERLFGQWQGREDERLVALRSLDRQTPYFRFVEAEIKIQWALVYLKFGKRYQAFTRLQKAHSLLKTNLDEYPAFTAHYKSMGFLKIVFNAIPEGYQWFFALWGMKGEAEEGLALLDRCIGEENGLFAAEADFIKQMCLALALRKPEEALQGLQALQKARPENLLLYGAGAMVALEAKNARLALRMLQAAPAGEAYMLPEYVHYMQGDVLLRLGRYAAAAESLHRFTREAKGQNYLKDAYYRLFLAEWFAGKPEAPRYLRLVQEKGQADTPADRYAQAFATASALPDREISRARLLFDGGEFKQALSVLEAVDPKSLPADIDRAELYYRTARVWQELGQTDRAIALFERAIAEDDPSAGRYYAPNSALQTGYLLQARGDCPAAVRHFQLALDYPAHEYKDSIDGKAKEALESCK